MTNRIIIYHVDDNGRNNASFDEDHFSIFFRNKIYEQIVCSMSSKRCSQEHVSINWNMSIFYIKTVLLCFLKLKIIEPMHFRKTWHTHILKCVSMWTRLSSAKSIFVVLDFKKDIFFLSFIVSNNHRLEFYRFDTVCIM